MEWEDSETAPTKKHAEREREMQKTRREDAAGFALEGSPLIGSSISGQTRWGTC